MIARHKKPLRYAFEDLSRIKPCIYAPDSTRDFYSELGHTFKEVGYI
ncbi:MAG: hypothetical protein LUQ38_10270 [Methanotrichaceae archaeon]|nr:hypothetical protein [Methanotrichaceae archaeon]